MPISKRQLEELVKEPLMAVLATVNSDGTPQATPLWYHYDGECFITTCFARRVKIRNIKENPNMTLVIGDTAHNGRGMIVRETAELVEDNVPAATLKNAIRYEGEERGRKSAAELTTGGARYIIRIMPHRIIYGE